MLDDIFLMHMFAINVVTLLNEKKTSHFNLMTVVLFPVIADIFYNHYFFNPFHKYLLYSY